jgi:hypothetical protein
MEMSARLAEVVATATASVFAHILSFSKKKFFEPSANGSSSHKHRTGVRFQGIDTSLLFFFPPFRGLRVSAQITFPIVCGGSFFGATPTNTSA